MSRDLARLRLAAVGVVATVGLTGAVVAMRATEPGTVEDTRRSTLATGDCNGNGVPDVQEIEPGFTTVALDPAADGAQSVVAADLDGDGDLDVLATYEDIDTVAWYENLGGGAFGSRRIINGAANAVSAAIAVDLDDDGDEDVFVAEKFSPVFFTWHENLDGAGSFGFAKPVDDSHGSHSRDLSAADFDGDGDLDVAIAQLGGNAIGWYENSGGPVVFVPGHFISGTLDSNTVFAGDLDGDTDADLLTASQENDTVTWYRNFDGEGNFVEAPTIDTNFKVPRSTRGADLDGDGDLDVLATSWRSNLVSWYENPGLGNFGPRQVIGAVGGAQVAIGVDLDNDSDLDVAVAAATGSTGPGDNSDCCQPTGYNGCSDVECQEIIDNTDPFCTEVDWDQICADEAIADPDCSVGCGGGTGRILWYENLDGTGTFGPAKLIHVAEGAYDVFAADVDGDGNQDLLSVAFVDDKLFLHRNTINDCNGNGVPDDCDLGSGAETDLDCDGVPDSCDPDGGAGVDCNGNTVADACDLSTAMSTDCTSNGIPDECEPDCDGNGQADSCDVATGAADANGNGIPDGCEPDCNGNGSPDDLDVSAGGSQDCDGDLVPDECQSDCDGNGVADACDTAISFSAHAISNQGFTASSGLTSADLDGDGDEDVIVASDAEDVVGWHENLDGAGTFGELRLIPFSGDNPRSVVAADIDGDTDLDLVVAWFGPLTWFENLDSKGAFGVGKEVTTLQASSPDAADMDGDGDMDVVSRFSGIRLHRNLDGKGGLWSQQSVYPQGDDPIAADMDSDGDLDIAFRTQTVDSNLFNTITWLENLDGAGTFGSPRALLPPDLSSLSSFFVADVDGDVDADIVVGTNLSVAWYENLGRGLFGPPDMIAYEDEVTSVGVADLDGDGDGDVVFGSWAFFAPPQVAWIENVGSGLFGTDRGFAAPIAAWSVLAAELDGDGDQDVITILLDAAASLRWFENHSNDCNGNGSPDLCESDCDGDGLLDVCAFTSGAAMDCNSNSVPDNCDTGCSGTCDGDGDLCEDALDAAPADPLACADTDGDGCDDCAAGTFDPGADGVDADLDGHCSVGDCSDGDGSVWSEPSDAVLLLSEAAGTTELAWQPPVAPGAVSVRYDVLRSPSPQDFFAGTVCLEADQPDTSAMDATIPASGSVLHYLIRTENDCPGSAGNLGSASAGTPRTGLACP